MTSHKFFRSPSMAATTPSNSPSPATPRQGWSAHDIALIGVFAALTAAVSFIPPLYIGGIVGVPLTLQTLMVTCTGLLLGPKRAFAAIGLYVVAGLAGLPVLPGFRAGITVIFTPSAGYLLSFPLAAALMGSISAGRPRTQARASTVRLWVAAGVGLTLIHAWGVLGMVINGGLSLPAALAADAAFIPGDVLKSVVAVLACATVLRAFPRVPHEGTSGLCEQEWQR